ncbi:hypothetical protein [Methylobacterium sp. A54F]
MRDVIKILAAGTLLTSYALVAPLMVESVAVRPPVGERGVVVARELMEPAGSAAHPPRRVRMAQASAA